VRNSSRTAVFVLDEVMRLVEWALSSTTDTLPYTSEPAPPGLLLVKDDGCYLMANTRPRQTRPGARGEEVVVVYAEGLESGSERYEIVRDVCGGDDFAEFLDLGLLLDMKKLAEQRLQHQPFHLGIDFEDDIFDLWME
jgi:hypothetical protein